MFEDGTQTDPLDFLVLATGYKYSFPFLEAADEILKPLNARQTAWGPLYELLVPVNEPDMFFVGLTNSSVGSMQVKERQAIVVQRVIDGLVALPSREEMLKNFEERLELSKKIRPDAQYFFEAHPAIPFVTEKIYGEKLQKLAGVPMDDEFQDILFNKVYKPLMIQITTCQYKDRHDQTLAEIPADYCPKEGLF